jgi:hypothetical protein
MKIMKLFGLRLKTKKSTTANTGFALATILDRTQ